MSAASAAPAANVVAKLSDVREGAAESGDRGAVSLPVELLDVPDGVEHASMLHACCDAPAQAAPPLDGGGLEQVRVCVPPPHDAEHAVHPDQAPSTAAAAIGK